MTYYFRVRPDDGFATDAKAMRVEGTLHSQAVRRCVSICLKKNRFKVSDFPMDFIATSPSGRKVRFRVKHIMPDGLTPSLVRLRSCRRCGCSDDRACDPPCSWVDVDLCSGCM